MKGFKVRYIYSACIVIEIDEVKILCDPWFTDGIYGGTWFQYPSPKHTTKIIGDVDYIFISHLHPDHYDPCFLRHYFDTYGEKEILISKRASANNFLYKKILKDLNIEAKIHKILRINNFDLYFFDSEPESIFSIDSALLIIDRTHNKAVANFNDCVYTKALSDSIKDILGDSTELVCALVPYSGANAFPHTYVNLDSSESDALAQKKISSNIGRMSQYLNDLNPNVFIPFAGKYYLGGSKALITMNPRRGIPDAVALKDLFPNCVVPQDGGTSGYDILKDKIFGEERHLPYNEVLITEYLTSKLKLNTLNDSADELIPCLNRLREKITLVNFQGDSSPAQKRGELWRCAFKGKVFER